MNAKTANLSNLIKLHFTNADQTKVKHLDSKKMHITAINGDMAMSTFYAINVSFIYPASTPIDAEVLLNKTAKIHFDEYKHSSNSKGSPPAIYGIVTSFEQQSYLTCGKSKNATDFIQYTITVRPKASYLLQSAHTQIFTLVTVPDIVEMILEPYNIQIKYEGTLKTNPDSLPILNFVFQFEETDANFLSRLLEKFGYFFYFEPGYGKHAGAEVMIVTDNSTSLKASQFLPTIKFQKSPQASPTDDVFMSLSKTSKAPPGAVVVKSYDYSKASNSLISTVYASDQHQKEDSQKGSKNSSHHSKKHTPKVASVHTKVHSVNKSSEIPSKSTLSGYVYETWSVDATTQQDVQTRAKIIMAAFKATSEVITVEVAANYVVPGDVIKVAHYPIDSINSDYLVIGVDYNFDFSDSVMANIGATTTGTDTMSVCTLSLIPISTPYCHPVTTPTPKISGFIPGIVTGGAEGTIQLTSKGEYTVQLPILGNDTYTTTCPMRKMEPSLHGHGGTYTPLKVGTEVLIVFQDGHPDVPIIMGAVCNSINPALVTGTNSHLSGQTFVPNATTDDEEDEEWNEGESAYGDDDADSKDTDSDSDSEDEWQDDNNDFGDDSDNDSWGDDDSSDEDYDEWEDFDFSDDESGENGDDFSDDDDLWSEPEEESDADLWAEPEDEDDDENEENTKEEEENDEEGWEREEEEAQEQGPVSAATITGQGITPNGQSKINTYLQGTLTQSPGWSPGNYHFHYDGTPGDSACQVTYPNGSVVSFTAKEAAEYHNVDKYSVCLGNNYSANIGDSYSITAGNSTSTVYGDSVEYIGQPGGTCGTSTQITYSDNYSTTHGNSTQVVHGDNSSTTHGNTKEDSFGNMISTTMGSETSTIMGSSFSTIMGPSNSVMMGEGSMIFMGVNTMMNLGMNIAMDAGFSAHFGEGLTLNLTPAKETETPVINSMTAGATEFTVNVTGVDILSAGIVTITAASIILNGAVTMTNAGVKTAEIGVKNEDGGVSSQVFGMSSDV